MSVLLKSRPTIFEASPFDMTRQLLGEDVILLPIATGEKAPRYSGWNETTVERMEEPEYQARFSGNIGVLLGKPSGGLCSLDVDSDEDLADFLELNPPLAASLQTKGERGGNVWVRVVGEYPDVTPLKRENGEAWGEFRSTGGQTIIHGVHPCGQAYQRIVDAQPCKIEFSEITWPADLQLPWKEDAYDTLVAEYGEPVQYGDQGRPLLNEPAIAAKFAQERLTLYEPDEAQFYQYSENSGLWTASSDDLIKNQFGTDLKRLSDDHGDRRILPLRTNSRLSSLSALLRGQVCRKDAFSHRQGYIHCSNGVLDLKSTPPAFRTFSPSDYSRNACPLPYTPDAKCPQFIDTLLRSALPEEDISLIQRAGGAMLMGANPAQRLLLLIGRAGGGKSTLVSIIERLIGLSNVAELRAEHLADRFETYSFLGRTLLTGKDVSADFLQQKGASKIKSLVGGDLLHCEKKGGAHFQIRGNYNAIITCNSDLHVRLEGDTDAWQRRLMIIRYDRPKSNTRVVDFADKLLAEEGSGILNFFVEGAQQHLLELKDIGDYRLSMVQAKRVEDILRESDSIRQFVETEIIAFEAGSLTTNELLAAYYQYCERNGWHAHPRNDVCKKLPDLMLEVHHVQRRNDIKRDQGAQRGYNDVCMRGSM